MHFHTCVPLYFILPHHPLPSPQWLSLPLSCHINSVPIFAFHPLPLELSFSPFIAPFLLSWPPSPYKVKLDSACERKLVVFVLWVWLILLKIVFPSPICPPFSDCHDFFSFFLWLENVPCFLYPSVCGFRLVLCPEGRYLSGRTSSSACSSCTGTGKNDSLVFIAPGGRIQRWECSKSRMLIWKRSADAQVKRTNRVN